ncbi:MAG: D-aminoacyl-tRNA deacylase [Planctomycetota bacterium]
MRLVIQRVLQASVEVNHQVIGSIDQGLMILVGVGQGDTENEARWLAEKAAGLRIFEDDQGKMNRSVVDVGGSALVVSQFTLLGDCRKGRRPAFTAAAHPEIADPLYQLFGNHLKQLGVPVQWGEFGADMKVALVNDGPVTLVIDTAE